MGEEALPAAGTPFGDRVRERLRDETVVWLSTIGADGTPQPNPVWFLADGDGDILVYNRADAWRLKHVRNRPRVSLHFESGGTGDEVVVLLGTAEVTDDPAAVDVPAYVTKYGDGMLRVSGGVREFSDAYPVPLRIRVDRVRGY